ncbi:protein FAM118A-like [Pleurodeles waltl]|uniref:protein FAM118A-like n=1 Tax=Pleurodeles waltl TaxID=8319 RepID=UPI0037097005
MVTPGDGLLPGAGGPRGRRGLTAALLPPARRGSGHAQAAPRSCPDPLRRQASEKSRSRDEAGDAGSALCPEGFVAAWCHCACAEDRCGFPVLLPKAHAQGNRTALRGYLYARARLMRLHTATVVLAFCAGVLKSHAHRTILTSLINKTPKDLVLVVGTGVSAAAAPGIDALNCFRCLLLAILDAAGNLQVLHPRTIRLYTKKVKRDSDLLSVANEIIRELSPRSGDSKPNFYRDCLMRIFSNLEYCITCPQVLNDVISLVEQGAMLVTTNYDTFLETSGKHKSKPMKSIDMSDPTKLIQWANGLEPYGVLHIHGVYDFPSGIAWNPKVHKELYHNTQITAALQNLYNSKTFVFLGCGEVLREHVFQALFWYPIKKKREVEHYMLVLKKDTDRFFKLQREMLLLGIKLISYGDNCAQFPGFLRELTELLRKEKPTEGGDLDDSDGGVSPPHEKDVGVRKKKAGTGSGESSEEGGVDRLTPHPSGRMASGSAVCWLGDEESSTVGSKTETCRPECAKKKVSILDWDEKKKPTQGNDDFCRQECAKRKVSILEWDGKKKQKQGNEGKHIH